jgi:hypothetical protein
MTLLALALVLTACSDPALNVAPGVSPDELARRRTTIELTAGSAIDTLPLDLRTALTGDRASTVVVLAGSRRGAGPCDPASGECLGVAGPLVQVARFSDTSGVTVLSWDHSPTTSPGATVHLQAAVLRQGAVVALSDVVSVPVRAYVPGCTYRGSPDYDPAANVEDGSCVCPALVEADSLAAFAPYATCSQLDRVILTGLTDPIVELAALADVSELILRASPGVTQLSLPALISLRDLSVTDNLALQTVSIPSAVRGHDAYFDGNPSLTGLDLSFTGGLESLWVSRSDAFTTLHLDGAQGLQSINLSSNAALERVELVDLPPWAEVAASGNPALGSLELTGSSQFLMLDLYDNPLLTTIRLPGTHTVDYFWMADLPSLTTLDAPDLSWVEGLRVRLTGLDTLELSAVSLEELEVTSNDALRTLRAPELVSLGYLSVEDNALLSTVDLPAIGTDAWTADFLNNPLLCVTAQPPFDAPPPGASLEGRDNLCDP